MTDANQEVACHQPTKVGTHLLAIATIAAGVLDLIWRDFDSGHQPIQSLGIPIPGRNVLACLVAAWMILAGAILLWKRTVRAGVWATATIYFIFSLFSIPRFASLTHKFGFHWTIIFGVMGEMCMQLIVVAGCITLWSCLFEEQSSVRRKLHITARSIVGIAGLLFGLAHFDNPSAPARMIPSWMPFHPNFWVFASGAGFVLAGLAILTGIWSALAARMLALMFLIFEVILVPIIFEHPQVHQAWGATAYNLAAASAVWIYATFLPFKFWNRIADGNAS